MQSDSLESLHNALFKPLPPTQSQQLVGVGRRREGRWSHRIGHSRLGTALKPEEQREGDTYHKRANSSIKPDDLSKTGLATSL